MSSCKSFINSNNAKSTASQQVWNKSSCLCLSVLGVNLIASSKTVFLGNIGSLVDFLGEMALLAGLSKGMCLLDDHKLGSGFYNTLSKQSSIAYYCAIGLLASDLVFQHSPATQSLKDVAALMTFGAVMSIALPTWAVTRDRARPVWTETSGVAGDQGSFGTGMQQ